MAGEAHLDEDCIFCKILRGEVPCFKVFEDDDILAFMDINPIAEGRALAIPKHHSKDILESPSQWVGKTFAGAKRIAEAVHETLKPDGINIVQTNGPGAKQSVLYLHVHIIPRTLDDGLTMNWELVPGDMDDICGLAERIAANME